MFTGAGRVLSFSGRACTFWSVDRRENDQIFAGPVRGHFGKGAGRNDPRHCIFGACTYPPLLCKLHAQHRKGNGQDRADPAHGGIAHCRDNTQFHDLSKRDVGCLCVRRLFDRENHSIQSAAFVAETVRALAASASGGWKIARERSSPSCLPNMQRAPRCRTMRSVSLQIRLCRMFPDTPAALMRRAA